jgi:hypothetical protein
MFSKKFIGHFSKIRKFYNFRNFSTVEKIENKGENELTNLNSYLKESLFSISKKNLKIPQVNIIESIDKSTPSLILCDDFNGRKYSCILGIMNRLFNRGTENHYSNLLTDSENSASESETEEFFVNTVDAFKKKKEQAHKNLEKKDKLPRGALVICQKFEFATHFYRISRRLDFKNKLRMMRVGTSLHTVAPTVELDVRYSIKQNLGQVHNRQ